MKKWNLSVSDLGSRGVDALSITIHNSTMSCNLKTMTEKS
jgi:hypothetical protein